MTKSENRPVDGCHHRGQTGKVMLPVLLALAAAVTGVVSYSLFSDSPDNSALEASQGESQADNAALAALQEQLQTSLALPTSFKTVQDFELIDVNNETLTQTVFDDTWSLVFFGFTQCPDICPVTLQIMKQVVALVEEDQAPAPQIVFVTVDPVRDTPDIMQQYIAYFDEDFIGITGDVKGIHELTSSLGIVASFTANDENPESYSVDHTASLLLIDPQRRVRAKVTPPHTAEKIAADYLTISRAPG